MCGISGLISNKPLNVSAFAAMNMAISHRGPDDEGFVFFDKEFNPTIVGSKDTALESWKSNDHYAPQLFIDQIQGEYFLAFGHRRLSIIDLSPAGHMPMCDINEQYWITYNGEIYNFIEIRTELESLGYNFHTNSDTEVILIAYKEWGANCLDRFMGMFSFAILDRKNKKLFLARDRFGIKPLYYWISDSGDFYFASEIKQFTFSKEWMPKLNHQRAFDYLYAGNTDHTEETMIKEVFQIPGGHTANIDLDQYVFIAGQSISLTQWYRPIEEKFNGTFEEAKNIFKNKFFESIKMHLRADVKVGCTLSGGFDSSSITCVVNELLEQKGKTDVQYTFSAIDGDSIYSEKKWIEVVLQHIKVTPYFITPNPEEALNELDKIVWQMDEPTGSLSPYLGYLVDRNAKEQGITVLLNGQGADEYLGGYSAFRKSAQLGALHSLNITSIQKEYDCSKIDAFKMSIRLHQ